MRYSSIILLSLIVMFVSGCAGFKTQEELTAEQTADALYESAAAALDKKKYLEATKLFEEVERQHPYSQWATQAQLMSAYSSYKDQRYDEAILALDRFIQLHPGNEDVDYAHYLKALCYYEQISDVSRDQFMTEQALDSLQAVIRRFPNSEYARDARLKSDLTLDHLAGKEMEVGRYYLKRGEVQAAINRFLIVVKDYQTTTHIAEALHRLVEAYLSVGLKQEALRVASVLGHNYPGNQWYERSFALLDEEGRKALQAKKGWMERTVDSLLSPN